MSVGWQAVVVALIAGTVGLAELVSRYRSDPKYVLTKSAAAWLYIVLNAGAGVGALFLIRAFGWTFGQTSNVELWRILVAGFGAIAFFRSSLFITKIGNTTVPVGPSLVLGALLDACDRDVDRKSAEDMSMVMLQENLGGLNPDTVQFALPVLTLALMQNFPPGEQAQLFADISNVRGADNLSPEAKMRAVAVHLAKYLGLDLVLRVLENAKEVFEAPTAPPIITPPAEAVIEEARRLAHEAVGDKPPLGEPGAEAPHPQPETPPN
jgi:hypothetical protein